MAVPDSSEVATARQFRDLAFGEVSDREPGSKHRGCHPESEAVGYGSFAVVASAGACDPGSRGGTGAGSYQASVKQAVSLATFELDG